MISMQANFFQEPMSKKRKDNNGNVVSSATSDRSDAIDIIGNNRSEQLTWSQDCNDLDTARLIELEEAVKTLKVSIDLTFAEKFGIGLKIKCFLEGKITIANQFTKKPENGEIASTEDQG